MQAAGERVPLHGLTWSELRGAVHTCATSLRELGVRPGDRVAACVSNVPESLVAFLAATSIGAIWSSCSPDFGASTVIDRFRQIEPVVLIATDGHVYGGREFDRRPEVRKLIAALPSLRHVIQLRGLGRGGEPISPGARAWQDLFDRAPVTEQEFRYEDTAFDAPLWIVYSGGGFACPAPPTCSGVMGTCSQTSG